MVLKPKSTSLAIARVISLLFVIFTLSFPQSARSWEPSWRSGPESAVEPVAVSNANDSDADQLKDDDQTKDGNPVSDSQDSQGSPDVQDSDGKQIAAGAPTPDGGSSKGVPDYTNKLRLKPGLRVTYRVHDGLDTRWKKIGDYEFTAEVEPRSGDYAYSYKWYMSDPVETSGIRAVAQDDLHTAHRVSLFYVDRQNCSLTGFTNILRVSDDLFRKLKQNHRTDFELDGPEVLMTYHRENVPLPHWIEAGDEEYVDVMVNDAPAKVRAIKTNTSNGWHYWVMDNPNFPIIVKADGPFRWDPPSFTGVSSEGRRIVNDLKLHGTATTHMILFDFDKDVLKPESKPILDTIGQYMHENKNVRLIVEGHCDSVGGYDYNINLSNRRAAAVRRYLVQHGGISDSRFQSKGYGWTRPIADNKTAHGRALNRRVVFKQF